MIIRTRIILITGIDVNCQFNGVTVEVGDRRHEILEQSVYNLVELLI